MNTIDRLVVGVDRDASSYRAGVAGVTLARALGCEFELVHAVAVAPPLWAGVGPDQLEEMRTSAMASARAHIEAELRPLLDGARLKDVSLADRLHVLGGHSVTVLLEESARFGADMVLLGPHRHRGVIDFGSTARGLLARSNALIWSQFGPCRTIRRILVPVDFSTESDRALAVATELARRLGARLEIVHCFAAPAFAYASAGEGYPGPTYVVDFERDREREQFDRLVESVDGVEVAASAFVEGGAVNEILLRAPGSDLVVMGTHGRTGLSRVLLGSIAYGVLKRAKTPVLGVPAADREWLLDGRTDGVARK